MPSLPQRLLLALARSPRPLPTPELVVLCDLRQDPNGRSQVYVSLKRLRISGLVEREIRPRLTGDRYNGRKMRTAYWRLT